MTARSQDNSSEDSATRTGAASWRQEERVLISFIASQSLERTEDLEIFEQDQYWVVHNVAVPLEMLSREFIFRIVDELFARVEYYHVRMLQRIAVELLLRSMEGKPDPELPVVKAALLIMDAEPVEWLNSTPLMRKLLTLLD